MIQLILNMTIKYNWLKLKLTQVSKYLYLKQKRLYKPWYIIKKKEK